MKSIDTLIKLHKRNLDEIVRKKKKAEEELENFETIRKQLVAESKEEIKKYHMGEYAFMLEQYLKDFRAKLEQLDGAINTYRQHIAKLMEELRAEFSEMKKFEIAKNNRLKENAEKELKKETKLLDEFTTRKYTRKK